MTGYAIISLGGKQYRVQEGERLLVDRVSHGEGKTFHPDVLFTGGGDGKPNLSPRVQVTAKVVAERRGKKIRIGKYRPKSGYKRHTGFRAALSEIEIESIGSKSSSATKAEPKAEAKPKPKAQAKPKPKAQARPKTPARKPAAKKPATKKAEK
jgi:large subunit ribosomal protein L21